MHCAVYNNLPLMNDVSSLLDVRETLPGNNFCSNVSSFAQGLAHTYLASRLRRPCVVKQLLNQHRSEVESVLNWHYLVILRLSAKISPFIEIKTTKTKENFHNFSVTFCKNYCNNLRFLRL